MNPRALLISFGLVAVAIWCYWPTLVQLEDRWSRDHLYSHGYLVPLFSLALLWMQRDKLSGVALGPSWWAAPVLLAGIGLRLLGTVYYLSWFEQIALLPILAAVALALGGWPALRWSWVGILFLGFMIPLPGRVEGLMAQPLQRLATVVSTNILQTLGVSAQSEGNVILLSEVELGIVEACAGLRMLVTFFALSTAVALVIQRSLLQRILIILSAPFIAVVCNVARITVTAGFHEAGRSDLAHVVFHDLAGWLMALLGLGMLWLELQLLSWLFIPTEADASTAEMTEGALHARGAASRAAEPTLAERAVRSERA
jgi:exosortase